MLANAAGAFAIVSALSVSLVLAKDYCYKVPDGQIDPTCFTGWPDIAVVCPHHPYYKDPYGYIEEDQMAFAVGDTSLQTTDCDPPQNGQQNCLTPWFAPQGKAGNPLVSYGWVRTIKSIRSDQIPSFFFNGFYWLQVFAIAALA